jgi:hypothetical protein
VQPLTITKVEYHATGNPVEVLTQSGNIIVNDVACSCYEVNEWYGYIESQDIRVFYALFGPDVMQTKILQLYIALWKPLELLIHSISDFPVFAATLCSSIAITIYGLPFYIIVFIYQQVSHKTNKGN